MIRRDRYGASHGGVCICIKDAIQLKTDDQVEVLSTQIRPTRLPRGITSIVIGTLYHPPSATYTPILTSFTTVYR